MVTDTPEVATPHGESVLGFALVVEAEAVVPVVWVAFDHNAWPCRCHDLRARGVLAASFNPPSVRGLGLGFRRCAPLRSAPRDRGLDGRGVGFALNFLDV